MLITRVNLVVIVGCDWVCIYWAGGPDQEGNVRERIAQGDDEGRGLDLEELWAATGVDCSYVSTSAIDRLPAGISLHLMLPVLVLPCLFWSYIVKLCSACLFLSLVGWDNLERDNNHL